MYPGAFEGVEAPEFPSILYLIFAWIFGIARSVLQTRDIGRSKTDILDSLFAFPLFNCSGGRLQKPIIGGQLPMYIKCRMALMACVHQIMVMGSW